MTETPPGEPPLPFTGERFVPGTRGEIWIEHWHRYHFAARWAAGRRVLDVACGEGYGSALLAATAAHVTGVDVSEAAIGHARGAYAGASNLDFACAPCTRLPLADASVDLAVSFETLEHILEQREFVDELARVLRPEGVLVLSCPNKLEYSDKRSYANEFHVRELYRAELAQLLGARFPEMAWHGQRPTFFSLIAPEAAAAAAQLVEVEESDPAHGSPRLESPLYFVVVAARSRAALEAVAPALSVLADRGDWVHRDYEHVMRDLQHHAGRGKTLERELAERDAALARRDAEANALRQEAREAARVRAELEATAARQALRLAECERTLGDQQREIERRRGWRWWLRLPLVRLGLLD